MKCHDRIAFSESNQFTCSHFGYLCLDNVYHILAYRYILDMYGFKVLTSISSETESDLSHQIRDLITHHTASTNIGVDKQGTYW